MKEEFIKYGDYISFFIEFDKDQDFEVSMKFKVYEVNGWGMDNKPEEEDTELYLSGYMKWDGCNHFTFGEEGSDGYMHLCGESEIDKLIDVMTKLKELARTKIKNFDKEVAK